ncbi:MAG TPA: glycine/sarcosine/betaine reductase complex component C subunit beta [bacterium]|nr:glycine/sarcosine/betaine reductase complex component C subunit beta [bacterium]
MSAGTVGPVRPVVRAARFAVAHVPGLVLSGSKPRREIAAGGEGVRTALRERLRSFEDAVGYPPHQVLLGTLAPEALREIARPWHLRPVAGAGPEGPGGTMIDELGFYEWLVRADRARLVHVSEEFAATLAGRLGDTRISTMSTDGLRRAVGQRAEPLYLGGGRQIGVVVPAHEEDESLAAPVLLENLAAKVTGALALRGLLGPSGGALPAAGDEPVDYLIGCGEEAVGDRYQRGGGNLAKAMGELAGVRTAGAVDVKAFCASPLHGLLLAGALVAGGVWRRVIVVAGGSLAKLGMKCRGHLAAGYPVLEDVIVGMAIDVAADDGRSPVLRLDAATVHRIADGTAPHQMAQVLTAAPLRAAGLKLGDVDRYAVELHNPDITEPAGSGDVPARNYQMIAALAVQVGEIARSDMSAFAEAHGMPGFSPTQGHIASAVAYLHHAVTGLTRGPLNRVQLVAKGSLFLGRMTELADGVSMLVERNTAGDSEGRKRA